VSENKSFKAKKKCFQYFNFWGFIYTIVALHFLIRYRFHVPGSHVIVVTGIRFLWRRRHLVSGNHDHSIRPCYTCYDRPPYDSYNLPQRSYNISTTFLQRSYNAPTTFLLQRQVIQSKNNNEKH